MDTAFISFSSSEKQKPIIHTHRNLVWTAQTLVGKQTNTHITQRERERERDIER